MYQTDFPQYLGAAAVVLACVGATRREEPGRGIARVLGLAALAGMALSLGTHFGPLHALLSALVPLWSSFRLAVNHLVVAQLAVALLSARGLDAALRAAGPDARAPRLRPRLATPERVLLAVAAAMFAGAAWLASPAGSGLYQAAAAAARPALAGAAAAAVATRASGDLLLRGAVLGAIALALAASRRTAWARVPALVAAFALAAADLASVDVGFLRRASGTTASFAHPPPPAIATAGARDPLQRVLAVRRDLFWGNDWIRWRARSITGYHPAVPQAWADLYGARLMGLPPVLRALGVGYISGQAVMPDTASFEPWPGAPANDPVWRVRGALPRAYAARTVEALPDQRAVLGALASPAFDPARLCVTTDLAAAGDYPGSPGCSLRWLRDEPEDLALEVSAAGRAFVVVADAWFPGWTASVDGRPVALHAVNRMLRGVAVPSGRHRLAMRYVPEGWAAGVTLTRSAFALWLVALGAWLLTRRRGHLPGDRP
jgi:hypothetical protein